MRLLLVTTAKHILSTVARVVAGCCQISSAANPVRSALYFSSWVKCALVSRGWSSVSIFEQTSQRRKENPRPLLLAVGFTSGVSPPRFTPVPSSRVGMGQSQTPRNSKSHQTSHERQHSGAHHCLLDRSSRRSGGRSCHLPEF